MKDHAGFSTSLTLRIDWSEMDLFGHVNNVMFMKYIQSARVNYWDILAQEGGLGGFMLASTSCQFKKPLYFPGNVKIYTHHQYIKNTSFGLLHQLFNDAGELVAEAQDVIVAYDYSKNEKVILSDSIKHFMENKN